MCKQGTVPGRVDTEVMGFVVGSVPAKSPQTTVGDVPEQLAVPKRKAM